jgi:mannose-6-phosphate isomerase-like protein (cupin superfamily)
MGQVVTFSELSGAAKGEGVSAAPITRGETTEMAAEYVRVEPGKRWSDTAPSGSDCYLFALSGEAALSAGSERHRLAAQTFATVEETVGFTVENDGRSPLDLVKVIAPPKPNSLGGFKEKLRVAERGKTPVLDVPEERKKRIIFVGHHAAQSERAHAMIVVYDGKTNTALHHHPNAESLFVLLDGAVEFTVNGKQEVLKPGQAVYFKANDIHSLHTADGHSGASFLEFHIPAAYSTVKIAKA